VLRRFRARLTFANVVSVIALFVALGGGAYAAFHLPKNSVRSKNIVNGQVKKPDLAASLKSPPTIHNVTSGAFENGWHNYAPDNTQTGFFRDREGVVHLRGSVAPQTSNSGGAEPIFTLPPGYRPAKLEEFAALTVNTGPTHAINQVEVQDDGVIQPIDDVGIWLSLSGITFRCGPSGKNGCP
jgi:hypothetical protein